MCRVVALSEIKHLGSSNTVANPHQDTAESICHRRCRSCAILLTNGWHIKHLRVFVMQCQEGLEQNARIVLAFVHRWWHAV